MALGGRSTQETQRRVFNRQFARGTKAKAQCPVCGLVQKYLDLRQDWRGVWVCPDCWDPRDPQETISVGSGRRDTGSPSTVA